MMDYYDKTGKPIGIEEYHKLKFNNEDYFRIGEKRMWFGKVWVSTVWLGLDHDHSWNIWNSENPNPNPVIFETMVFWKGQGDVEMDRYRTEAEAIAGHRRMVLKWCNPFHVLRKVVGR